MRVWWVCVRVCMCACVRVCVCGAGWVCALLWSLSLSLPHTWPEIVGSNLSLTKSFFSRKINCWLEGIIPTFKVTFLSHFLPIQLARSYLDSFFLLFLYFFYFWSCSSKIFGSPWLQSISIKMPTYFDIASNNLERKFEPLFSIIPYFAKNTDTKRFYIKKI